MTAISGLLSADTLLKVFEYLDGVDLMRVRCVCRYWRTVGGDGALWRRVALRVSNTVTSDPHAWSLLCGGAGWQRGYMAFFDRAAQPARVEVYTRGISVFDVVAYRVRGPAVVLTRQLIVYRRFRTALLHEAIANNASVFYLAPARYDADLLSYGALACSLSRKDQVGLALGEQMGAVLPPSFFVRNEFKYKGDGLLLVVQEGFPHLCRESHQRRSGMRR